MGREDLRKAPRHLGGDAVELGLGRFPVTLYYEQRMRLLDASKDQRAFLEKNKDKLKLKQK